MILIHLLISWSISLNQFWIFFYLKFYNFILGVLKIGSSNFQAHTGQRFPSSTLTRAYAGLLSENFYYNKFMSSWLLSTPPSLFASGLPKCCFVGPSSQRQDICPAQFHLLFLMYLSMPTLSFNFDLMVFMLILSLLFIFRINRSMAFCVTLILFIIFVFMGQVWLYYSSEILCWLDLNFLYCPPWLCTKLKLLKRMVNVEDLWSPTTVLKLLSHISFISLSILTYFGILSPFIKQHKVMYRN